MLNKAANSDQITDSVVTEETTNAQSTGLQLADAVEQENWDSLLAITKNYINYFLWLLGLFAIPWTIIGIILLVTYRPKSREIVDNLGNG